MRPMRELAVEERLDGRGAAPDVPGAISQLCIHEKPDPLEVRRGPSASGRLTLAARSAPDPWHRHRSPSTAVGPSHHRRAVAPAGFARLDRSPRRRRPPSASHRAGTSGLPLFGASFVPTIQRPASLRLHIRYDDWPARKPAEPAVPLRLFESCSTRAARARGPDRPVAVGALQVLQVTRPAVCNCVGLVAGGSHPKQHIPRGIKSARCANALPRARVIGLEGTCRPSRPVRGWWPHRPGCDTGARWPPTWPSGNYCGKTRTRPFA